ncbi:MAG: carboxypeptidase-like regulatory domain-containing protein [Dysgonamonadaceae bacterium]|jgi:TonB-dependent receptor|nr:carboxypeptidase-like regulatory domain-containing protein [Dysgonamonadaceae bacterium]
MIKRLCLTFFLLAEIATLNAQTGTVTGIITDKKSGESIIGAIVLIENTNAGAITDIDGKFVISGITAGKYILKASYLSYQTAEANLEVATGQTVEISIAMVEEARMLEEVTVVSVRKMNTELSMLQAQKAALNVVSGVSSQQIARTQDKDASEVIKRIPGISILDNKFIIARGLAQRYNNVWINNNGVPSSEADSRSFAFDMIPSSQIENIMIAKSPAPELPADFTGGFVNVSTKNMPSENTTQISYGLNFNVNTHLRDFKYARGSATDILGFDNGFRDMRSVVPNQRMDNSDAALVTDVTRNGFNNDWTVHSKRPLPDQRFSLALNRYKKTDKGRLGLVAALNYSYTRQTYFNVTNARFGVYNKSEDMPVCLYDYIDNQYTTTAKTGGLLNMTWMNNRHRLEFRNLLNQIGRDRYTDRAGWRNVSSKNIEQKAEYFYSSRGSYTSQLSGNHMLSGGHQLDWTAGYAYANRNQPDRREIEREEKPADPYKGQFYIDHGDIVRDFNRLDENIYSIAANYRRDFAFDGFRPSLKAGIYAESRNRQYNTRYFQYHLVLRNLPEDFPYRDVTSEIMRPENFSFDKLYIYDESNQINNYTGRNRLGSGYFGLNLPLDRLNIYAGLRYENNNMELDNYVTIASGQKETHSYTGSDFFPSVNAAYHFNKEHLLRIACGRAINRQEFREVSPSKYYDFDLFSFVGGNTNLKAAYIQNFDIRYEIYPSDGEMVSIALFYKRFTDPIEWTYLDAGGTYTFTFENAEKANNYGLELDVRKSMDFIGLPRFSLSFNGAVVNSKVIFGENSIEHDRPMQGQSPYIVNTGIFYQTGGLNLSLLYNTIGKRIVGIGRSNSGQGGSVDNDVPDMYEMARHVIDLSFGYKFGEKAELSAGIRDLLAQPLVYKQFPKFTGSDGTIRQREQTTKRFNPGQNFSVTFKINL